MDHVFSIPPSWFTDRVIGIDPLIPGSCVTTFDSVASMRPFTSMGLESGAKKMDTMLMPKRSKIINPRRTRIRNENFATIVLEFKNSLDPERNESTAPELKLLSDGSENPESGAFVVAGGADDSLDELELLPKSGIRPAKPLGADDDDDDDDDDEDDDDDGSIRYILILFIDE
jgi:hypothetical protein